jgi:4'-phosphopantetheinyl transferase EntD
VIRPALRSLLPPEVAVVAGPVSGFTGPLFPQEQAAIARAVPKRVAEFTAGRIAARWALSQAGVTTVALERGAGGAVVWPAGATGSISHGGGMVAAVAVARVGVAADVATLGVDLEPLSDRAEGLVETIATPEEADRARTWEGGLLRVFSAKEAAFKALYPRVGAYFGFHALEVTLADRGFVAQLTRPLGPAAAGATVTGGQAIAAGFVVSAVVLRGEMWRE